MQQILKGIVCSWSLFAFACQPPPVTDPDCGAPGADPIECGTGPFCGGIAGIACPGVGTCEDNPYDSCDPSKGGADCGGACVCNALAKCKAGYRFDNSPSVCSCVLASDASCAAVTCAYGSDCQIVDRQAVCVPVLDPCAAVNCVSGYVCQTVNGAASCVPIIRDPCAHFDCPAGYRCVAPADAPYCVKSAGERCGDVTCAEGTECCNSSCGICVPPGGFCLQMGCE